MSNHEALDDFHKIEKARFELWLRVVKEDRINRFDLLDEIKKISTLLDAYKEKHILSYPPTPQELEDAERRERKREREKENQQEEA